MAMDLLFGVVAYAISFLTGEYEEGVRRGLLMTGGRRFVSLRRVAMAKARADQTKAARGADADPKEAFVPVV